MSSTGTAFTGKIVARTASIGLEKASNTLLQDCFRQFEIQIIPMEDDPEVAFNRQKFEACILKLYDENAEKILKAARNSPSNRRIVVYGIARNTQEALRHSTYGINAIFDEPLERSSVLKVVRATHLLVIHELRRYVRLPVVGEATVEAGARSTAVMTMEISAGGMSVKSGAPLPSDDIVRLTVTLPDLPRTTVKARVCWARPGDQMYGLRFEATDPGRIKIRNWIDQYLEIM